MTMINSGLKGLIVDCFDAGLASKTVVYHSAILDAGNGSGNFTTTWI